MILICQVTSHKHSFKWSCDFKGCVRYIFASLFGMFKREHLEKCFLFHFESSSRS